MSQAQFKPVKVETVHFNEQQSPSPFVGKKPNPTLNQYLLEPVKSDSNPIAPYDLHRPNSFRSILHSNNNPYPSSGLVQQSLLSLPPPFTNHMTNTNAASVELQPVVASSANKKREKRDGKGSSESEMEQLVVQELNESPKSVFSRLQILRRTTLDDDRKAVADQATSQNVRKIQKSSSSGEDESDLSRKRDQHIKTNSSTNNNKRPSDLKDSPLSSSSSSSNSELEQSDQHSASLTNSASANDHDENSNSNDDDGQNDSRTSSFDKNNTGSKSKKLSK